MHVSYVTFTGTAEEYTLVAHLFDKKPTTIPDTDEASTNDQKKIIRHVLQRIPVQDTQIDFFKTLASAGEAGIYSSDLAAALEFTPKQLTGALGALGRRINGTEEVTQEMPPPGTKLFIDTKNTARGLHYTLKPLIIEVLQELKHI
jgi:hypothetical protein